MHYIVDSSVVIGNMLLESVKQNNFSIPIRELCDHERALAEGKTTNFFH